MRWISLVTISLAGRHWHMQDAAAGHSLSLANARSALSCPLCPRRGGNPLSQRSFFNSARAPAAASQTNRHLQNRYEESSSVSALNLSREPGYRRLCSDCLTDPLVFFKGSPWNVIQHDRVRILQTSNQGVMPLSCYSAGLGLSISDVRILN